MKKLDTTNDSCILIMSKEEVEFLYQISTDFEHLNRHDPMTSEVSKRFFKEISQEMNKEKKMSTQVEMQNCNTLPIEILEKLRRNLAILFVLYRAKDDVTQGELKTVKKIIAQMWEKEKTSQLKD